MIREETVLCEVTATHLFNSDPQGTATRLLINSTSLASDTATFSSTVPHLRVTLQPSHQQYPTCEWHCNAPTASISSRKLPCEALHFHRKKKFSLFRHYILHEKICIVKTTLSSNFHENSTFPSLHFHLYQAEFSLENYHQFRTEIFRPSNISNFDLLDFEIFSHHTHTILKNLSRDL